MFTLLYWLNFITKSCGKVYCTVFFKETRLLKFYLLPVSACAYVCTHSCVYTVNAKPSSGKGVHSLNSIFLKSEDFPRLRYTRITCFNVDWCDRILWITTCSGKVFPQRLYVYTGKAYGSGVSLNPF